LADVVIRRIRQCSNEQETDAEHNSRPRSNVKPSFPALLITDGRRLRSDAKYIANFWQKPIYEMSEEHSRWQGRRYGWQESLHSVGEFRYFLSGWPNVSRCSKANKVSKLNSFHYFYYLSKYEFIQREAASAVYAVVVCPSIRPSVQHKPVLYQILNVGSRKQIRAI